MSEHNKNELTAWIDWKEKCDIKKCSKESRDILNEYADITLKQNIAKISFSKLNSSNFMNGASFALFEMHSLEKKYTNRKEELAGKTYKEGLFFKVANAKGYELAAIKNYFKLYLRATIRENYVDNANNEVSLNNSTSDDGAEVEFIDLLESELFVENEHEIEELKNISNYLADIIFNKMTFNHKAIILAFFLELAISTSKALKEITGLEKTALRDNFNYIVSRKDYKYLIKEKHPREPENIINELYAFSFYQMKEKIISWGKSEIRCKPLFIEVEKKEKEKEKNVSLQKEETHEK